MFLATCDPRFTVTADGMGVSIVYEALKLDGHGADIEVTSHLIMY